MLGSRISRWTAGTLALCVLLLVGFWFVLVGPRRADAAELRDQRDKTIASNDTLKLEIAQLKSQAAALPQRQADLAKIKREFPPQVQLPKLIRDLDTMATQTGVTLESLTPGSPTAVTNTGTAAAAGGTTAAKGQAAQGQAGLLKVAVTIRVTGDYFQVATFVKRLQQMDRATLLTGTQIVQAQTEDSGAGNVSATLVGEIFVLPDSEAAAASVAGPGASAPGATGSGTTTQ